MAYYAPYIDGTGFHRPLYSDILDYLISSFKEIYGQDCYLENDSADYQWLSVVARCLNDVLSVAQQCYNNRSVATAQGVALDGLVKLNGIKRKSASYSTCVVTLTGEPNTIITNGMVRDIGGYYWSLPQITIIGSTGTVSVTATCTAIGSISALPGTITTIATPQYGWTSVTNEEAASEGLPIESDEELRARQALSTRLASHTMLSGTEAGIAAVQNVTRYKIHENYTNYEDNPEHTPPHSITCIVEGGTDEDVAAAIFLNRGIGCATYGGIDDEYRVEQVIKDPDTGNEVTIYFRRPKYIPIYANITIRALEGYVSSIASNIKSAVINYLNSLQIGQDLTVSAIYSVAMSQMSDIKTPTFSVTKVEIGLTPEVLTSNDISIAFDEVTCGIDDDSPEYISITVEE